MRIRQRIAAAALVVLAGGAGLALADTPDQIIAARQAGYKHIGQLMGDMHKAIENGDDVTTLAAPAQEIADWGHKIPTLFPPGTDQGHNTHAKPEIWSDRAGFEKAAANMAAAAEKLVAVARSGDKAAFADQWKATGTACGACHRTYRSRIL